MNRVASSLRLTNVGNQGKDFPANNEKPGSSLISKESIQKIPREDSGSPVAIFKIDGSSCSSPFAWQPYLSKLPKLLPGAQRTGLVAQSSARAVLAIRPIFSKIVPHTGASEDSFNRDPSTSNPKPAPGTSFTQEQTLSGSREDCIVLNNTLPQGPVPLARSDDAPQPQEKASQKPVPETPRDPKNRLVPELPTPPETNRLSAKSILKKVHPELSVMGSSKHPSGNLNLPETDKERTGSVVSAGRGTANSPRKKVTFSKDKILVFYQRQQSSGPEVAINRMRRVRA